MGYFSRLIAAVVLFSVLSLPKTMAADEYITLNFQDADITAVINTIADLTGKTFIIDPRVKGKVNVISSQPLLKDDVFGVFLSILEVHGYTTESVGKAVKVIPDARSMTTSQPVVDRVLDDRDELITHVLPLQYVSAQELVPILRPMMGKSGHLAAYPESNRLILSDKASNIQRMLAIVERVDKNTEQEIEIIPLQHALGSEIVRLLDKVLPQNPNDPRSKVSVGVDERSNSILISGSKAKRLEIRALISHLDTPMAAEGNTQVVYLRYANAENVATILSGLSEHMNTTEGGTKNGARTKNSNIQADVESNALVITSPASEFKSLRAVIQKLDMPRAQVHIEAIIAEVSMDTALELGVEWVVDGSTNLRSTKPVGGTNFSNNGGTLTNILGAVQSGTLPSIGDGLNLAVGRFEEGSTRFGALLRALASDASTNILSTPSLTTLDNQEAEIVVGQNVPFVAGEFTTNTSGADNPFRTIERKDVGITLKVKPQINEGDAITLMIEQDISSVSPSSVGAVDLITNKRTITTTVMVADDEMIVLGGLIDEDLKKTLSKVPILGSIPLLGRLFSFEKTTKLKRNLMVFIHPKIIGDLATGRMISQSKYLYLQEQQILLNNDKDLLEEPELPELLEQQAPVDNAKKETPEESGMNSPEDEENR